MISVTIGQLAPHLMFHLADAAMRSIVLACLAALVLAGFRVRHVTPQLAAWTGMLYAALAMPVLAWLLPAIPVRLRIPDRQVAAAIPISSAGQVGEPYKKTLVERAERSGRSLRAGRTLRALSVVSVSMKTVMNWRGAGAASSISAGKDSGQTAGAWAQPERQGDASAGLLQMASEFGARVEAAADAAAAPRAVIIYSQCLHAGTHVFAGTSRGWARLERPPAAKRRAGR